MRTAHQDRALKFKKCRFYFVCREAHSPKALNQTNTNLLKLKTNITNTLKSKVGKSLPFAYKLSHKLPLIFFYKFFLKVEVRVPDLT